MTWYWVWHLWFYLKVEQKTYPVDLRYWRHAWHRVLFCRPTLAPGISTISVIRKCYQNNSNSYLERRAHKDRGNSTAQELEGSACELCSSQLTDWAKDSASPAFRVFRRRKRKTRPLSQSFGVAMATARENALRIHPTPQCKSTLQTSGC